MAPQQVRQPFDNAMALADMHKVPLSPSSSAPDFDGSDAERAVEEPVPIEELTQAACAEEAALTPKEAALLRQVEELKKLVAAHQAEQAPQRPARSETQPWTRKAVRKLLAQFPRTEDNMGIPDEIITATEEEAADWPKTCKHELPHWITCAEMVEILHEMRLNTFAEVVTREGLAPDSAYLDQWRTGDLKVIVLCHGSHFNVALNGGAHGMQAAAEAAGLTDNDDCRGAKLLRESLPRAIVPRNWNAGDCGPGAAVITAKIEVALADLENRKSVVRPPPPGEETVGKPIDSEMPPASTPAGQSDKPLSTKLQSALGGGQKKAPVEGCPRRAGAEAAEAPTARGRAP